MGVSDFMNKIVPGKSNEPNYSILRGDDASSSLPLPVPNNSSSDSNTFSQKFKRLNPFQNGSVRLPAVTDSQRLRREEREIDNSISDDPGLLNLSKWDRMLIFALFFAGSIICFLICFFLFPVLSLKPRKFATLWSLGSIFFVVSFIFLQGFKNYFTHLFSKERIYFTLFFFSSIFLTLVSSLYFKSIILSIIFCIVQLISVIWYTVSYFPMGKQTLRLASNVAYHQAESWINS
ncbi:Sft2p [Ascoidea rubescens DSM 1968]|uniref:Protein transport protein SFT2 n=1 Tax=Ascoidea rubescens DSM 1968 TaxID=1344418 RepID=A0A1D2VE17_9ASCO|nr:SFT2-domain-containing protein [Ascoidea rubescens DSM 1968]ODV59934.1 SFT2-domain-containing protein [Ascoidea rubescens DSM 1968]